MQSSGIKSSTSQTSKDNPSSTQKNIPLIRQTLQRALREIKQQSSGTCRTLSFIKRISLDLDSQKMQQMLKDLQKGYVVIKHSPNTSQPHTKFVYVSSDRRFLCWKSLEKDDEKMIELRKIQNVLKSEVQFKLESRTVKCFDKVVVIRSDVRSLEVQFRSVEEKEKFYEEVRMAIKNSRRMNLSYKF